MKPLPMCWIVLCAFCAFAAPYSWGEEKINFSRDIHPLLSANCFACHGPDEKARKAKLRLDTGDGVFKVHDGVAAIVPGDISKSELVRRILTTDPDDHMPPAESEKKLTPHQIDLLKRWIAEGADYTGHWSFQPVKAPAAPEVDPKLTVRTAIDRCVFEMLEKEGLQPSAEADRATLIRRLTLDLTGLPPTLAEIDAFIKDESPDAYEKVVDRLLASPHYGERMALAWLDAARFADTNGYHIDAGRDMTRWREWVIDAFNSNMPFDQFTIWQLAGDLLPDPTLEQKIASGFNRNHMINFEGGAIPEEYHTAYLVDRVNTTATVWLGLTVGCAQCHDHKFDPIKQKEFYELVAFFNHVPENGLDGSKGNAVPMIKTPTRSQEERLSEIVAEIKKAEESLSTANADADAEQAKWEAEVAAKKQTLWTLLEASDFSSKGGAKMEKMVSKSIRVSGANPAKDVYTVKVEKVPAGTTGFRFEVLPEASLAGKGPGRSVNGNMVLSDIKFLVDGKQLKLGHASVDFSQKDFSAAGAIDGNPATAWNIFPQVGKAHQLIVDLAEPLKAETAVTAVIEFNSKYENHQAGHFRLGATDSADPHAGAATPENVAKILAIAADKRTAAQLAEVRQYYRASVSKTFKAASDRIAELKKEQKETEATERTTMVMQEMAKPRDTFLLMRGQYDHPGEKVSADVPAFLPPLPKDAPHNRLGLAKWLVSKEQPLTARVIVNRYWQMYFGDGIVKTAEDFGSQGEWPSHPQLLDYLASQFMQSGWDVKGLQKMIVMSETYRQSSKATAEGMAKDPENRLLARGPRIRLPAEFIRDQALAISGLLSDEIGGASVSPYQPAGLWEELMSREDGKNWTAQTYVQSHGKDLYKRTMYTFWKRTSPPPTLGTFDAPSREVCTVRRSRTNTPLQALVLMNDPTYIEASRKMAERILGEGGQTTAERITFVFRLATGRAPTLAEMIVLQRAYGQQAAKYRGSPELAEKLLKVGEAPVNGKFDKGELAAWSMVSSIILNLDETITKN